MHPASNASLRVSSSSFAVMKMTGHFDSDWKADIAGTYVACWRFADRGECAMPDERRLTVAPHRFKFLQNFRNCFNAQQKSHRAMPPPRVVVSYDHTQAARKHYIRAGGY